MELRFFFDPKTDTMEQITVIEKNQYDNNYIYISCDVSAKYVFLFCRFDNIEQQNNYLKDCVELPTELINQDLVNMMIKQFTEDK